MEPVPHPHVQGEPGLGPDRGHPTLLAETRRDAGAGGQDRDDVHVQGATAEVPRQGRTRQAVGRHHHRVHDAGEDELLAGGFHRRPGRISRAAGGEPYNGWTTTYSAGINKGYLVVDTPDLLAHFKPGCGTGARRGNLVLHELGPSGLGHVSNARLLMNPAFSSGTPPTGNVRPPVTLPGWLWSVERLAVSPAGVLLLGALVGRTLTDTVIRSDQQTTKGLAVSRLQRLVPESLDDQQRALYELISAGPRAAGPQAFRLVDDDGALEGPFNAMLLCPVLGTALQEAVPPSDIAPPLHGSRPAREMAPSWP